MNFSKSFKLSNGYSGILFSLFIVLLIAGFLMLMNNFSNSNGNSNNYYGNTTPISSSYIPKNNINKKISPILPSMSLPKNDTKPLFNNSKTLEEEIVSNMAPVISNENLGNPSYLPVINSNLTSTDISEL